MVNLTVTYGSENQKVISDDRFSSLTSSIKCSASFDLITYTFKDEDSYKKIVDNWEWVNKQVFRSFILTTTHSGCQATPDANGRQAFQVNGITWNAGQHQAALKVQAKTFKDATGASDTTGHSRNTWSMIVDSKGIKPAGQQKRQSLDKTFTIDLSSDFTQNIARVGPFSIDCTKCGTQGNLNFRFQYAPHIFTSSTGSAELDTVGVGASAQITISASGNADPLMKTFELGQIDLPGGFSISGIASFGPKLRVDVGVSLSSVDASGSATFGANLNIPDSVARADLFSSGNSIDGGRFVPHFTPIPFTAMGEATLKGSIGPVVTVFIDASIFSKGASAGLVLSVPTLELDAKGSANTQGGVCNNPNTKAGVSFALGVGAAIDGFAGLSPPSDQPNRKNLFSTQVNLYSTCVGVVKRAEATPTPISVPELV